MKTEESWKIVGIVLVRNEDLYISRVLHNALPFCDTWIVLDNYSTDNTYSKLEDFIDLHPDFHLYRINDVVQSHSYIESYANTKTWIFALDGDELYDATGLSTLRAELLKNKWSQYWKVYGHVMHCKNIDFKNQFAKGYMSPPSRSMTKLYNFSLIKSWSNCSERLHEGNLVFLDSANEQTMEYNLTTTWEQSIFRCLHLAFIKRSSQVIHLYSRLIPNEVKQSKLFLGKIKNVFKVILKKDWKHKHYAKGRQRTINIVSFLKP